MNLTPTHGLAAYSHIHNNPKLGHAVSAAAIAGVGDRAFEITGPHTAGIYFAKGDALVVVSVVTYAAASAPKTQALAMAKIAANRL